MKVKLKRNIFVKAQLKKKGSVIEVDDNLAKELVSWGKAEFLKEEVKEGK